MYYVYIIKSKFKERYYTGSSNNHLVRLKSHNSGKVKSTKAYRPWKIIYLETFEHKSGNAFKKLIASYWRDGRVVECGGLENR